MPLLVCDRRAPGRTLSFHAMSGELDWSRDALSERYDNEREIGRGGMATVYVAQDLKHHRPVAVKVLHPDLAANLGPERFLREIQIAARLQHPHILPLYDSGQGAGLLYYVMPYVEGESLRRRLEREKRLPVDDALEIARAVAAALDYAHRRSEEHTSELQSPCNLVCRLLLGKKKVPGSSAYFDRGVVRYS